MGKQRLTGQRLQSIREDWGLTQEQFGRLVSLSSKYISVIETEGQPIPEKTWTKIRNVIAQGREAALERLKRDPRFDPRRRSRSVGPRATALPSESIRDHLLRLCTPDQMRQLQICVLAVADLPTSESQSTQDRMSLLLQDGATFRIFWISDFVPVPAFDEAIASLRRIVLRAGINDRPAVVHYCEQLRLTDEPATKEFRDQYESYVNSNERCQVFKEAAERGSDCGEVRQSLIDAVSSVCPLGIYGLRDSTNVLFVNISLRHLSVEPGGPGLKDEFLYYPYHKAIKLYRAVRCLTNNFNDLDGQA